jgi:hypothetical protein
VSGESDYTGGLCGRNYSGTITSCYATGVVSGDSYTGGLCGRNEYGSITSCYWDTLATGMTTSDGGTGLTTAQMQQQSSFAGWDFAGETANGTNDYWIMPQAGGYPVLSFFSEGYTAPELAGSGSVSDPYLIESAEQLGAMIHYSSSAGYRLAGDIDLSGIEWNSAPIPSFSGSLDGAGFKITSLTITGGGYLGLIGQLGSGGYVANLGIENCSINGLERYTGGLCGYNGGSITSCYATGRVSGDSYTGGLCGKNYNGSITSCYATGRVSGESNTGGLCGYNSSGSITSCYATGAVSGGNYDTGGLCGYSVGSITSCYATGAVSGGSYTGGLCGGNWGPITGCYWDTLASGMTTSSGGTGLTTAQMQQQSSFAGWDFYGETANGTEDKWFMPDGGYPVLTAVSAQVSFSAGLHGAITAGDAVQFVEQGSAATAPTVTADSDWAFTGWDTDFSNVTSALIVTAQYSALYFVQFNPGSHGAITSGQAQQIILEGDSATAPTVTADSDWVFTGWDTDFSNVTSALIVTAQYAPAVCNVAFVAGEHGEIVSGNAAQQIPYGDSAVAPSILPDMGYAFTGWDALLSPITAHTTITAQYSRICLVGFSAGSHGTITSGQVQQIILEGEAAEAPQVVPHAGYVFTGWDVNFDYVVSDLTVTALYSVQTFTVTFLPSLHGSFSSGDAEQVVDYGTSAEAPQVAPEEYYNFTGWDVDFGSVVSDLTVTAQYEIYHYNVTFLAGDHGAIDGEQTLQVDHGASAAPPSVIEDDGWLFYGWSELLNNITADKTIIAQYLALYTVTFNAGEFGEITSGKAVQEVPEGYYATAPYVRADTDYTFAGWDVDFTGVSNDITVTAQYFKTLLTVSFNAGAHGVISGGDAEQTILYGESATAPQISADFAYDFAGWDADFDSVTSDMVVTAQYTYGITKGAGTPEDPYLIYTRSGLEAVNDGLTASYALMRNIDLTGISYDTSLIAPDTGIESGFDAELFSGSFDGNGHSIRGLAVSAASYAGLFGALDSAAEVRNLRLVGCSVSASGKNAGAIAALSYGDITLCRADGDVSASENAGGICGLNFGAISESETDATVTAGGSNAGGIAGQSYQAAISECAASGSVSAASAAGGICGYNTYYAAIRDCFSDAQVSADDKAGGLIGTAYYLATADTSLCTGSVTSSGVNVGGVVGYNYFATLTNCFWDAGASGISTSPAGTPLTTAQAQAKASFIGFDFSADETDGASDIWLIDEPNYPAIASLAQASADIDGSGAVDFADLCALADNWLDYGCAAPDWCEGADVSMDGKVDLEDAAGLAPKYGPHRVLP